MQENEYLGHTVARITALGPDVVLVHRPVSRLAQDRFRQCGVTLVLNVKLSVLERVARCTGGAIVSTIDHLTTRYKLGNCQKFYLRNFPNDKSTSIAKNRSSINQIPITVIIFLFLLQTDTRP